MWAGLFFNFFVIFVAVSYHSRRFAAILANEDPRVLKHKQATNSTI